MQILACRDVRAAEQAAFASGQCRSLELMDAVVEELWRCLQEHPAWRDWQPARLVVYAGKGNNAGDALGLAARFRCPVTLRSAVPVEELSADTRCQLSRLPQGYSLAAPQQQRGLLIVDGLLGSGARGELRPPYPALLREMNALREASPASRLLAIDLPTGLDADSGVAQPDTARADATAAIGAVKPGLLADGAEDYVGRLLCIPLPGVSLPSGGEERVADDAEFCACLPRRAYSCFKNRAGRVAVVAGSVGMLGAAQMAAEAAVLAGAGLVVLYCLPELYPLLAPRVAPELMLRPVRSYAEIEEPQADVLLIGPGLGMLPPQESAALRRLAASFGGVVVLDADGLNMAAREAWDFGPKMILTPHLGEMRRLDARSASSRRTQALRFAAEKGCVLLLKGARTIVTDGQRLCYNSSGGPFMANGGQGDTLAGVIAALAGQGLPPFQAASMGAYLCGLAGEAAAARLGEARAVPASLLARELPAQLGRLS